MPWGINKMTNVLITAPEVCLTRGLCVNTDWTCNIATALHLSLAHLENKDSCVRMLFIDFSSAFNTVIPQHLVNKLSAIGINTQLCNWLLDFLTNRPQTVRVGKNSSETTIMNTGVPQGCVLSPLLFTLMTHDCCARSSSNHIIKFADDTTVVGLISSDDDSAYREEVLQLINWCDINNLHLNVNKTKEITVDFRKNRKPHTPLTINGGAVESVKSTKFLGVHITDWPDMDNQHHLPCQESTAIPPLPTQDEESQPPPFCTHHLLQGSHWEHPHQQSLSLVWQLPCCWPEGLTEGGEDSRKDHHISPTIHTGPIPIPLLQKSHQHHQGPHPPFTQTVLPPTLWQALQQYAL